MDAIRQAEVATVAFVGDSASGEPRELPNNYFPGYLIKSEIHRGGQGVVYRATQPSTGQTVAIKLMHGGAGIGQTGRARFDLEVQVLGRLEHPGIVKVYDSGVTEDGSVYYVMEYIAGQPLDALIRDWRRDADRSRGIGTDSRSASRSAAISTSALRERLEIFVKICEGVSAAHIAGVIHRDLKPANIRLDKRGEPVVVDFGLAKMLREQGQAAGHDVMTTTGQFVGSMPWSSPEQAEGANRAVDTRSDVYSLGVILYQMVTSGRFPYTVVGTARQVMNNIVGAEPKRPSLFDRGVNDEIETIVLKAISKEPERRYQSSGEFARDIRRYLDGDAIEAKRDSSWYVMSKALRRHRLPVGFVAIMVLMASAFTVALAAKYTENEAMRIDAEGRAISESIARQQADSARERATANFRAVHELSRAFLFEFHDEISDLRGAGDARGLLVGHAAEYLERLRTQADAEAEPEPGLLLDLASAYDRLAMLQAGFAASNRGESAQAEKSVEQAERIRDELIELIPDDPALWLAIASGAGQRARIEQAKGKFQDAIGHGVRGIEAVDRALEFGASEEDAGRARASLGTMLGDMEHRLGRAADGSDAAIARLDSAIGWYDAAKKWWGENPEIEGAGLAVADLMYRRSRSTTEIARWHLRAADGDDAETQTAEDLAIEGGLLAAKSKEAYESLRADDASARAALRGMIVVLMQESLAWETLGRVQDARGEPTGIVNRRAFERAQSALTFSRVLAGDETDLDGLRMLGIAMNKVGNALRRQGRLDEAEVLYDELIAHRNGIVSTDPTPRHKRDLAIGFIKRAQIDQIRAGDETGEQADALLTSAEAGYVRAQELFEQLASAGVPMDRELGEVRRTLSAVRAQLGD